MSPDIEAAVKAVDKKMNVSLDELKAQFSEGHSEENIMIGFHDYVTNWTSYSRDEIATMYVRAMIRLAKSAESI